MWYQSADTHDTHRHSRVYTPVNTTFSKSRSEIKVEKNIKFRKTDYAMNYLPPKKYIQDLVRII